MRYQIKFADIDGNLCIVDIFRFGVNDTSKPIQLTASASPFVTDEDDSPEPMNPIRATTGVLTVICKIHDVIDITSSTEWRVELRRNNKLRFSGFLKEEALDMDFNANEEEFSYTVTDNLEALSGFLFENSSNFASIGEIIFEALGKVGVTNLVVGDSILKSPFYEGDTNGYDINILNKKINRMLWHTEEDGDAVTYADVLSDICTSLGVTARTYEDKIVLCSCLDNNYTLCTFENGTVNPIERNECASINKLEYSGLHTISLTPSVKNITIRTESNPYKFETLEVSERTMKFNGASSAVVYNEKDEAIKECKIKVYKPKDSSIEVGDVSLGFPFENGVKYIGEFYNGTGDDRDTGASTDKQFEPGLACEYNNYLYFVCKQYNEGGMTDSGFVFYDNTITTQGPNTPTEELNDLFRQSVHNVAIGILTSLSNPNNAPCLTMRKKNVVPAFGGIDINISATFLSGVFHNGRMSVLKDTSDTLPWNIENKNINSGFVLNYFALCTLKIGDMYAMCADGQDVTFSQNPHNYMVIPVDKRNTSDGWNGFGDWKHTRKTPRCGNIDVSFGATGFSISLKNLSGAFGTGGVDNTPTSNINGDLEFKCYGFFHDTRTVYQPGVTRYTQRICHVPLTAVDKISISNIMDYANEDKEETAVSSFVSDKSNDDEINVTLKIYSDANVKAGYGAIIDNEQSVIHNSFIGTVTFFERKDPLLNGFPTRTSNELILDRYKSVYCHKNYLSKVVVKNNQEDFHTQRVVLQNCTAYINSIKTDWRKNTATLTLLTGDKLPKF